MTKKTCRFDIDFFEFMFLTEACIPPVPIARGGFWNDVINKYYFKLSSKEKFQLFRFINNNESFKLSLSKGDLDCKLFNARYDPDNQYEVSYSQKEEVGVVDCFKWNNKFVDSQKHVNEELIIKSNKK